MSILHITPGYSAGKSLNEALSETRPRDKILSWPDDLSCGPIINDDPLARAEWWRYTDGDFNLSFLLQDFWKRVAECNDDLVVWFARHAAGELAFFLNWVDRLGDRFYRVIDTTGQRFLKTTRDGTKMLTEPAQAVSLLGPSSLATLVGSERELEIGEKAQAKERWSTLRVENTPFRIVTEKGLVSAPEAYFDRLLIEQASQDWQKVSRLIGTTMINNDDPYIQTGDRMLHIRMVVLVQDGKLLADGDPWDMRACHVRLPR